MESTVRRPTCTVPHWHPVVSLSKALRKAFLYSRDLLHKLPGLAWRAHLSVLQDLSGQPDGRAGEVLCNRTFSTSDLSWHPHVHGIAMAGVFTQDGRFIRGTREDLAQKAQERFEQKQNETRDMPLPVLADRSPELGRIACPRLGLDTEVLGAGYLMLGNAGATKG